MSSTKVGKMGDKKKVNQKQIKEFNSVIKKYELQARIDLLEEMIGENSLNIVLESHNSATEYMKREFILEYLKNKLKNIRKG